MFQKAQGLGISQVELKTQRSRKQLRGSGDLGSESGPAQPPETEDKEGNCCLGSGSKTQKKQTSVKVSTCFFKPDLLTVYVQKPGHGKKKRARTLPRKQLAQNLNLNWIKSLGLLLVYRKIDRMKKYVKYHSKNTTSKISNVGNSTGQTTQLLQQISVKETKKFKKPLRDLLIKCNL